MTILTDAARSAFTNLETKRRDSSIVKVEKDLTLMINLYSYKVDNRRGVDE